MTGDALNCPNTQDVTNTLNSGWSPLTSYLFPASPSYFRFPGRLDCGLGPALAWRDIYVQSDAFLLVSAARFYRRPGQMLCGVQSVRSREACARLSLMLQGDLSSALPRALVLTPVPQLLCLVSHCSNSPGS